MQRLITAEDFSFRHQGYCDICEKKVEFAASRSWSRDHLVFPGCQSVPRERALMDVLKRYCPQYPKLKIHESSPIGRGVSARLARECRKYSMSQYFPQTPLGDVNPVHKARRESLE